MASEKDLVDASSQSKHVPCAIPVEFALKTYFQVIFINWAVNKYSHDHLHSSFHVLMSLYVDNVQKAGFVSENMVSSTSNSFNDGARQQPVYPPTLLAGRVPAPGTTLQRPGLSRKRWELTFQQLAFTFLTIDSNPVTQYDTYSTD